MLEIIQKVIIDGQINFEEVSNKCIQLIINFIQKILPQYDLKKFSLNFSNIFQLEEEIFKFLEKFKYLKESEIHFSLKKITILLGKMIFENDLSKIKLIESIFYFAQGDLENVDPELLLLFNIPSSRFNTFKVIES